MFVGSSWSRFLLPAHEEVLALVAPLRAEEDLQLDQVLARVEASFEDPVHEPPLSVGVGGGDAVDPRRVVGHGADRQPQERLLGHGAERLFLELLRGLVRPAVHLEGDPQVGLLDVERDDLALGVALQGFEQFSFGGAADQLALDCGHLPTPFERTAQAPCSRCPEGPPPCSEGN